MVGEEWWPEQAVAENKSRWHPGNGSTELTALHFLGSVSASLLSITFFPLPSSAQLTSICGPPPPSRRRVPLVKLSNFSAVDSLFLFFRSRRDAALRAAEQYINDYFNGGKSTL